MRISFSGLDTPIEVCQRGATVLRMMNERLFARVCESLISLDGEGAIEPYSIWDDNGCEMNPAKTLMIIANPFDLPWRHRSMVGCLYTAFEEEMGSDEHARRETQEIRIALESLIRRLGFQLNGDYRFGVEWSLESYLKAFSFEVDISDSTSLLENLVSFIDFGADIRINKVLVFVNLKTFLTESELLKFNERLFFHGMAALLLENQASRFSGKIAREYLVDRDFIEYIFEKGSEFPSSSQGGFCSNGFGAVTF